MSDDDDLELPPELRAVEAAVRAAREVAPTRDLAAVARALAEPPVVSARLVARDALRCTFCHDALAAREAALCADCQAPHHDDCFVLHGGCAAPGCGATRWVGVARPRRVGPWLGAAAVVGAFVAVAAIRSSHSSTADELARVESLATERARPRTSSRGTPASVDRLAPVEARMTGSQPDWAAITSELLVLERDATEVERVRIRGLRERCAENQHDEGLYMRAVDIVAVRAVERYPEAIRLLEAVRPTSHIHPDAQAYIRWIETDLKVREAQRVYAGGDGPRALRLLDDAGLVDVLGPESRADLGRVLRSRWTGVIAADRRGHEAVAAGRDPEALEAFREVLSLEPDPQNRYHARAAVQLRLLHERASLNLERRLADGLDALEDARYEEALLAFADLAGHPGRTAADLQKIQDAVVEANRVRRLLKAANVDFLADRSERLLEIYHLTRLLRRWLPELDPARDEADTLYRQVVKRLRALQLLAEEPGEGD